MGTLEAAVCAREGVRGSLVMTVQVPSKPASAAIVRRRIAADLAEAQLPRALVDDVVLIATELVSNAIRHAHALPDGSLTVSWEVRDEGVTVKVTDGGAIGHPHIRYAGPNDVSGRGLSLVAALAARWGVEDNAGATTVWAHLG
jgi:anti-sigma regulatory factor (Ser/Thr protein kinase)